MDIQDKINVLKVQLETIQIMMEKQNDCTQILQHFKLVKNGLNKVIKEYINSDLKNCLKEPGNQKRIDEIIKLISF